MDYSCIEVLTEDNIDDFYQLNDKILKKNYENNDYLDQNIMIFSIKINRRRVYDHGLILQVDNSKFLHDWNSYEGGSGSVIINKNNNLVIGMHQGELIIEENKNYNKNKKILNVGIFIKDIIEDIRSTKKNNNLIINKNLSEI